MHWQAISSVRVLSYERSSKMLLADVAAEYTALRNGTLVAPRALTLEPAKPHSLPLPDRPGAGQCRERSFRWAPEMALPLHATYRATCRLRGSAHP